MVDGSTVSMPDTPANQRAFPRHINQKRGCGFPIARFVVLLSLATGSVLDAAIGASKGKLTGEHALLRSLHRRLKPGDIVRGDAYYSSFDEVMALVQMGVDVVMRQTGNRPGAITLAESCIERKIEAVPLVELANLGNL
jgi:hypothetical protein